MANQVYANGREISCKAGSGKSICAFPDVCMTPPESPATPPGVPIPYPNTGMASDTDGGSKKVKISNKEVMLKNKSSFKKSTGDEAGAAAKKGVVTSVNRGKVYFNAWSMDVKVEGENVVRHFDLTTHNHACLPCNAPPMLYMDEMFLAAIEAWGEAHDVCECCGNEKHSKGPEVTEDEFYNTPQAQAVLKEAREKGCGGLLPEPPCNKYYIASKKEKDRIETQWDEYRPEYYQENGLAPSTNVGHRVPKAAGGCPTGNGNLAVVGPECEAIESKLSLQQGRRIQAHRKRLGI